MVHMRRDRLEEKRMRAADKRNDPARDVMTASPDSRMGTSGEVGGREMRYTIPPEQASVRVIGA